MKREQARQEGAARARERREEKEGEGGGQGREGLAAQPHHRTRTHKHAKHMLPRRPYHCSHRAATFSMT